MVAANRDEYYARPTVPADYWHEHPDVLGGRDLEKGGTWIAATRDGRWAAVTNYRDPAAAPGGRSRGELVAAYVNRANDPATYAVVADAASAAYPPFNLLLGNSSELVYVTNRGKPATRTLGAGIYGLSNHLLDTPWPKVTQARQRLSMLLQSRDESAVIDGLFELLADRQCAPDHALPATGVSLAWERVLSAPFIVAPGYGTRASTVLIVRSDGSALFEERSFSEGGVPSDARRFDFEVRVAQAERH